VDIVVISEAYFEHLVDEVAVADFSERVLEELKLKIEIHAFRPVEADKTSVDRHV